MFHLAARRGERSASQGGRRREEKGRERRAPPAKEKEERGKTGIDRARERESKVTNAKVIVLRSYPAERIYRVPCDDTLAFPRSEGGGAAQRGR